MMPFPYSPPLTEIRFVLNRLIGLDKITSLPGYDSLSDDLLDAVLTEAGKIASEVFAPLNDVGDKNGIKFADGKITMPPGFKDAYRAYIDGGWNGLQVEEQFGGQGLPAIVGMAVAEMVQAANVALALCPMLNGGAIELISSHADEATKAKYLPKLVSGEWGGTMNLTESQAGSDVGAVKAKAIKEDDHYLITGQKIFISYGDHDMVENVVHLVLARLPDAPAGTKGLSLFLVPKFLVNDDGSLGPNNEVSVVSVEHKLGQHSSPTCVMAFGDKKGSVGYLVGKENGGIAAMFTMMNNARMNVGVQGLGVMERAFQHARDYAKFRVQSAPIDDRKGNPVTIINHPDVRRMLLDMKSHTEAGRAIAYHCALAIDTMRKAQDDAVKTAAAARVELLTPIVKAWVTDRSSEVASTGIQVFGGVGYVEEAGAAQHLRDARVLMIYEGTNGIQSQDLTFRKVLHDQGATFRVMTDEIDAFIKSASLDDKPSCFKIMHENLSHALAGLMDAALWLLQDGKNNPLAAAASATPFLKLFGNVLGGFYLVREAFLAQDDLDAKQGDPEFLASKIVTAHFFATHILPLTSGLARSVREGAEATLASTETTFG
ncbi:MAG: acyl-CoA dehydrogenase [Alphaproteobacteria bacterium]|nr:acyl-CoA dehydrogenase [Alphaproteobacteria bacterium]